MPVARVLRPLLLGMILLPFNAWWAADGMGDVIFSLIAPPLCSLMAVALLNLPLRRFLPRHALSGGELALFYVFLSAGTVMASEWMLINNQYIHTYALYADRNPWDKEHILPNLPDWFYFKDAAALEDYRRGGFGIAHFIGRLGVWAKPIAAWTTLFGLLCGAMLCINTLMRDQWCRRERLSFPLIQVPVLLTRPESPAWKSKYLWCAFAVMFAIDILNGLAFLYPNVPSLNVRYLVSRLTDVLPWTDNMPWTPIGWTSITIIPYMSAIGIFMPTDLLFSCVFFFFVRKGSQVLLASYGYEQGVFGGGGLIPSAPYFSEQTWGAFFGLFIGAVMAARPYLGELWRAIKAGTRLTPGEMPPRRALIGLAACLAGLGVIGLLCRLSPWTVIAYVLVFLVFSVALTRMRAQLGPPLHELAFLGPNQLVLDIWGGKALTEAANVRLYHLFFVTNRIHRTDPMPYQLEGYKLAEGTGFTPRGVFWTLLGATLAGVIVGQLAYALHGYVFGAQPSWQDANTALRQMSEQRHDPNPAAMLSIVLGFSVVMLLDAIRFRVPGFPLHPVGYALSMNFGIDYFWFGLLIVLLIKVMTQRYFGLKGYEKLRLAAIGVILGEFAAELIWSVIYLTTHITTYSVSFYGRGIGWLK